MPKKVRNKKKDIVVEQIKTDTDLTEAERLMSVGEYEKAKDILEKFYEYDVFKKSPDSNFTQYICVNLALALQKIGEVDNGIFVLKTLEDASSKPDTYFVNLSLLLLSKREYADSESVCKQGLKLFPTDHDILGNMTLALLGQDKLTEALETANQRISISRDEHSLEELARVHYKLAESQKNKEFPSAIENYKTALRYLEEAKQLNPNFESVRMSISNILFKLRKYIESSSEALEVGKASNTTNEVQLFYTARNMLWLGGFEDCLDFCNKWLQKFPNSVLLKRLRAEALVDGFVIDNYQDGVRVVEQSSLDFFTNIIKDEKNRLASDFKFLAKIHAWMGDEENINIAMSILNEGITLFPDYWIFDFTQSTIFQQFEYFDEALESALEAKRKAPWREKNYFLLSLIYKKMDDSINASEYEQEGIKLKEYKNKLYAES